MNIQLRDSKTLQEAMYKDSKRNSLPRAQLHPELHEARITTESGGFVIKSDNPIDRRNMESFMIAPSSCTTTWIMTGKSNARIPSELIFAFDTGGKVVIRTQAVDDVTRLTSAIPSDRTARFEVAYEDGQFTFTRASTEKPAPTSARSDEDLQVEAAKLGVKWDKRASRETMLLKLEEARKASDPA